MVMLRGDSIGLRTVRPSDLEALYAYHEDISNRGDFFPVAVSSWSAFEQQFAANGFWSDAEGMLPIVDGGDVILGHIEFYPTVAYLDELELSYQLYEPASHGRGATTEAVRLLTSHLFERKKVNRIRLVIHPGNEASRRVASKSGYTFEGVARGAWYHRGQNHDVEIHAITRSDHRALPGR